MAASIKHILRIVLMVRWAAFAVCKVLAILITVKAMAQSTGEQVIQPVNAAIDDAALRESQRLVVMIETDLGLGAGIIFGRSGNDIAIATANHVVRSGDRTATTPRVQFLDAPGVWVNSRLAPNFAPERELDLALLTVPASAAPFDDVCMLPFDRLDRDITVTRGTEVYPVGFPYGAPWATPLQADLVASAAGDVLSFQSSFIAQGMSGGALLDEQGTLLGMIKNDQPPFGVAVALPRVLDQLAAWGQTILLYDPAHRAATEPLHALTATGDLDGIRQLMANCHDPNDRNLEGATPIWAAVAAGSIEVTRFLLDAGVSLETGSASSTLIHNAVSGGNPSVLRMLLAHGLSPDEVANDGSTALHLAAMRNDVTMARHLINAHANINATMFIPNTWFDRWGQTPLHIAAAHESVEVLHLLLKSNAAVDRREDPDYGATPLHIAARAGSVGAVQALLAAGADPKARLYKNSDSLTPLELAIIGVTTGDSEPVAAVKIVDLLLSNGANPNNRADFGVELPLHLAIKAGHDDLIVLLSKRGADLNGRDGDERAPLHAAVLASGSGKERLIDTLLEQGAQLDPVDRYGRTPMHLAAEQGLTSVIRRLADAGASVDSFDRDQQTPLVFAIKEGQDDAITELLELKANPNAAPLIATQPLHAAAAKANQEAVAQLITAGAYLEAMDKNGDTALHLALRHLTYRYVTNDASLRDAYLAVAEDLIAAGANPDVANSSRETPRDMTADIQQLQHLASLPDPPSVSSHPTLNTPVIQVGHADQVLTAAVTPDSSIIATGAKDGVIILWDRSTGLQIRRLIGQRGAVQDLNFATKGTRLVSTGDDSTVRVWDAATGHQMAAVSHSQPLLSADISDDGQFLVGVGVGGLVLWRFNSQTGHYDVFGELAGRMRRVRFSPKNDSLLLIADSGATLLRTSDGDTILSWNGATDAQFTEDGKSIWVMQDGSVSQIDIATQAVLHQWAGPSNTWRGAITTPDIAGRMLVADISGNRTILTSMDAETGFEIASGMVPNQVSGVVLIPGESTIIALKQNSKHMNLSSWSLETGREQPLFVPPQQLSIQTITAVNGNKEIVVTGTVEHKLWAARLRDGRVVEMRDLGREEEKWRSGAKFTAPLYGRWIAAIGRHDPIMTVWNIENTFERLDVEGDFSANSRFNGRFGTAPFGNDLAVIGTENVSLWNLEAGLSLGVFPSPGVSAVALTPDHKTMLATAYSGDHLIFWDTQTGVSRSQPSSGPYYNLIAVSPDGLTAAFAGTDSVVRLWSLERGREIDALGRAPLHSLAFSSDGLWLVAGGDSTVMLWRLDQPQQPIELIGHSGQVTAVAFPAALGLVVTGGKDGTVRFWDPQSGEERLKVALFADGDWVAKTPPGEFVTSKRGLRKLALFADGEFAPSEEIAARFLNPIAVEAAVQQPQ